MNAQQLLTRTSHGGDGVYTVAMTIPTDVPEDSSQYYMNQSPTAHPYAFTEEAVPSSQPVGRQPLRSRMNMTPEISHSIIKDAVMMILGALAGVGLFYAVTRSFDDLAGYAVFFGLGAGFPFGWRALSFMNSIIASLGFSFRFRGDILVFLNLLIILPLMLYAVKVGLAVIIGVPALVFSVARHLWRVFLN